MAITVLSAGAGSGKTYALTERMAALIEQGVRPSGIIATTFTQKAAIELYERVRARLLKSGRAEAAHALSSALIGTVHSIGARLIQRFAFEAGASPRVEIIPASEHKRLFNESLARILTPTRVNTMNQLADRLGLNKKGSNETFDWRAHVQDITNAARANMISAEELQWSKSRSLETFFAFLPAPVIPSRESWEAQLGTLLKQTIQAIETNTADDTRKTREAVEELRALYTSLQQRGFLYWYEWAKLEKIEVAAKSRNLLEPLQTFAQRHSEHPAFREDIRQYVCLAFEIAADALKEYQNYKRKRGLIDYIDMETQVAQLLRIPAVRQTLANEIDLLLVDEFQDTSPIQLDIFLQLSRLARQAIWVGDQKQSIYGFRGAEPALMQAVVEATGGIQPENILRHSWRSRPEIIHFVNALFSQAFRSLPTDQVTLEPALPAERYTHPAAPTGILHWHFLCQDDHRKVPGKPWIEHCIARQIRHLLEEPIPVWNKKRTHTRPLQPGDIAVLCRTNQDCKIMAKALHHMGLKAALEREGLLQTTEGRLVVACLKYLLNPGDALSAAEILVLSGAQTLDELVNQRLSGLQEQSSLHWPPLNENSPLYELNQLRAQTADMSPVEILHLLMTKLHLQHLVAQWGQAERRLDNLDRLRYYAVEYESACQRVHAGASIGGFLLWLDDLAHANEDLQGSGQSPDTIRVMTYHRSKGLEFPLVVCCQLDTKPKEQLWSVSMQTDFSCLDLNNVLAGRWVRFWVNPYADQWKGTSLAKAIQQSDLWRLEVQRMHEEEARLLYVGLTRARDYLVLPTTAKGTPWISRVLFQDESVPLFDSQSEELPLTWNGHSLRCTLKVLFEPTRTPEALPPLKEVQTYFKPSSEIPVKSPPNLWIDPSAELPPDFSLHWDEPISFAQPLPFREEHSIALREVTQAFLTADRPDLDEEQRLQLAIAIIQNWGMRHIEPLALIQHSEAFRRWFWPHCASTPSIVADFPIEGFVDQRRIRITIDLLWEDDKQAIGIFWADLAKDKSNWKDCIRSLAPRIAWAAFLWTKSQPCKAISWWGLFAVEGQAVQFTGKMPDCIFE